MELAQGIKELVVQDVKRRIAEESIPRIQKCIHLLTDDQIWRKPNKHSNSIGNLILHLEGDVVDFSYPITLLDNEGSEIVINDATELDEALIDCGFIGDGDQVLLLAGTASAGGFGCYEINFPLEFVMHDGDILSITTMDEYLEQLNNAENIVYPVSVTLIEDGSIVTLEDTYDIFDLLEDCGFNGGGDQLILLDGTTATGGSGCYEINFPLEFVMHDGNNLSIATMDEYLEQLSNAATLFYPISVTLIEDGSVVTLEDINDIFTLLEDCEG